MKIKMTKNAALTQLFYYAAMLSLLTGIIGFAILYATAISQGIPVFLVGTIAHLGTVFSTVDGSGSTPISSLIIAFLVQYRKTMLVIGLILTAIQAWLKHDAGYKLTLGNIFARPVSDSASTPKSPSTPVTPVDPVIPPSPTRPVTPVSPETTTESRKLTVRMTPSKPRASDIPPSAPGSTAAPGKNMKRLNDL